MLRAADPIPEERMAWIMGSSRSGSTWLLRMLCEIDDSVGIDDPHLGHHLGVWRPIPLAWAAGEEPPATTTLLDVKREKPGYFFNERYADTWRPLLHDLIAGRFAAQAEGHEGPLFVKEPGSQAAELLLSLFPRSHLVFLLRDGRDVVDSWLAAYQDGTWAQAEGAFPLAREGREAFIRWQASVWAYRTQAVARAFEAHDPDRRVLVRYEDLLAQPALELARICATLDEVPEPETLARAAATHDIAAVADSRKGEDREIRIASPGTWRENLTPDEQAAMMEELGETLERFGYIDAAVPAAA